VPLPPYLDPHKADHRILCVAIGLGGTLVTKDAALRIKGSQLGVAVEDYRGDTARVEEHTTGILELDVDPHVLDLTAPRRQGPARRDDSPTSAATGCGPTPAWCCAPAGRAPGSAGSSTSTTTGRDVHRVRATGRCSGWRPATSARPSRSTCCSTRTCRACR
jgi:hypothetical protein